MIKCYEGYRKTIEILLEEYKKYNENYNIDDFMRMLDTFFPFGAIERIQTEADAKIYF